MLSAIRRYPRPSSLPRYGSHDAGPAAFPRAPSPSPWQLPQSEPRSSYFKDSSGARSTRATSSPTSSAASEGDSFGGRCEAPSASAPREVHGPNHGMVGVGSPSGGGVRRMCEHPVGGPGTAEELLERGDVERPREVVALAPSTSQPYQLGKLF